MRQLIGYAMSFLVVATLAYAFTPRDPLPLPATTLHADRVQINDLLAQDHRLLAVGERGTILFSTDNALSWQSANVVPQRSITLTGVTALNSHILIAVGHDGWLLRSEDGGLNWQEVTHDEALGEPLLGVWSPGGERVVVFGSYGKFFESVDAGLSWRSREVSVEGFHLNGMDGGPDGREMLVGEQGLVMRSSDSGQNWETVPQFYNGSLFGVARLSDERWVVYGMRGHMFVTHDFGQSWQQIDLNHSNSLYGHVVLPDGSGLVLVGADSSLVRLDAQLRLLDSSRRNGLGTLTSAAALNQRLILVGGERGVSQGANDSLAARY